MDVKAIRKVWRQTDLLRLRVKTAKFITAPEHVRCNFFTSRNFPKERLRVRRDGVEDALELGAAITVDPIDDGSGEESIDAKVGDTHRDVHGHAQVQDL